MKSSIWFWASLAFSICALFPTLANSQDAASEQALSETQAMLQDPAQRSKVIGNSATAQTVDAQVKSLAGNSQTTDELYKISGKVLDDLTKETAGDPVKMMQIMSQAQSDPEALMKHVSDENKAAIHSIANDIDSSPTTTANRKPAQVK